MLLLLPWSCLHNWTYVAVFHHLMRGSKVLVHESLCLIQDTLDYYCVKGTRAFGPIEPSQVVRLDIITS